MLYFLVRVTSKLKINMVTTSPPGLGLSCRFQRKIPGLFLKGLVEGVHIFACSVCSVPTDFSFDSVVLFSGGGRFGVASSQRRNKKLEAPSLSYSFDAQTFDDSKSSQSSQPRSPFNAQVRNSPPRGGGTGAGGGMHAKRIAAARPLSPRSRDRDLPSSASSFSDGAASLRDAKSHNRSGSRRFAYTDPLSAGERLKRYLSQKLSSGDPILSASTASADSSKSAKKNTSKGMFGGSESAKNVRCFLLFLVVFACRAF